LYSFVYLWFSAQQPVSDSGGHLDSAGRRLLTLPPIPDAQRPYPDGTAAGQPLVVGGTVNPADTHNISGEAFIFFLPSQPSFFSLLKVSPDPAVLTWWSYVMCALRGLE
jgi:hypothetical protein